MSKPTMVPGVPSLMMHLTKYVITRVNSPIERKPDAPIISWIVSAGFPTTEQRSLRTKLAFQARGGLIQMSQTWRHLTISSFVPPPEASERPLQRTRQTRRVLAHPKLRWRVLSEGMISQDKENVRNDKRGTNVPRERLGKFLQGHLLK